MKPFFGWSLDKVKNSYYQGLTKIRFSIDITQVKLSFHKCRKISQQHKLNGIRSGSVLPCETSVLLALPKVLRFEKSTPRYIASRHSCR